MLLEKPLAPTLDEARTIVAKAREVGRQVIVAEQYRFWPAERTVLKLLRDGVIGRVDHATLVDRRNQPASGEGPWFAGTRVRASAGHRRPPFQLARACGSASRRTVFARAWRTPWSDYQGKCSTEAVLGFGDVHVQYLGTLASHRFGTSLWIEGEQGAIWTNRKYVATRKRGSAGSSAGAQRRGAQGRRGALSQRRDDLAARQPARLRCESGAVAETAAQDNIWSIAMLEAGKRADRERREVAIDELLRRERLAPHR